MNKSIEIYNYIESDSRDYHMCRICLEEDLIQKFCSKVILSMVKTV